MLHELFLALSGHRSSLLDNVSLEVKENQSSVVPNLPNHENESQSSLDFHQKEKQTDCYKSNSFQGNILGCSSLFHPCELKIISEIIELGHLYQNIRNFYNKIADSSTVTETTSNEITGRGHYITSFATALYEETDEYQKCVVDLERKYLENPQLLFSSVLLTVSPFKYVFLELNHLINVVEKQKLHGCKILDYLHKKVTLSVGEIQEVFKRIKTKVQKPLIEQLTHWVLRGKLLDEHKELFLTLTQTLTNDKSGKPSQPIKFKEKHSEVSLDVAMLPEFIPLAVAEKILFIGESILSFHKEGTNSQTGAFMQDREKEFLDQFVTLSSQNPFSVSDFVDLIEAVRVCVAKHLYYLVMSNGLITELKIIKDIFLLGRGELYQAFFILSTNKKLNITNVNTFFQRAAHQIMMEEKVLDKVIVSHKTSSPQCEQEQAWKNLRIDYKVDWPLHKFFNSKVQNKYNTILQFLLDIRQSQLRLQYLWVTQKKHKEFRCSKVDVLCWALRHHMILLIYNIQYYIQVDVIESRYSELKEHLENMKDYQYLDFQHQAFLAAITTQCFLSHPIISSSISDILEMINGFCGLLQLPQTSQLLSQIETIEENFDRASAKFFWALNTLGQNRNCRHTSQLVMRIDYNKFFSKKKSFRRVLEQD